MAASDIILQVSRANRFQARCEYFSIVASIEIANNPEATPDQWKFARASIGGTLDLQRIALVVLANSVIAENVRTAGDPEGATIADGEIEAAIAAIVPTLGKAIL